MKTLKIIATFLISCFSTMIATAQFNTFVGTVGGFTSPTTIQTIGIGTFPTINDVQSHLHVNAFYCSPSTATPFVDNGELPVY